MRIGLTVLAATLAVAGAAHAGSQSSNTSSNSSSNNGVVRDRVVDTYCEDGHCTRSVHRRVYRDDRGAYRDRAYERRRHADERYDPYGRHQSSRYIEYRYRDDDDD